MLIEKHNVGVSDPTSKRGLKLMAVCGVGMR